MSKEVHSEEPLHEVGRRFLEDRTLLWEDVRLAAVAGVARAGWMLVVLIYSSTSFTCRLVEAISEQFSQTRIVVWISTVEFEDGKAHTVEGCLHSTLSFTSRQGIVTFIYPIQTTNMSTMQQVLHQYVEKHNARKRDLQSRSTAWLRSYTDGLNLPDTNLSKSQLIRIILSKEFPAR